MDLIMLQMREDRQRTWPWGAVVGLLVASVGCAPELAGRQGDLSGPMVALLNRPLSAVRERPLPIEVFATNIVQPSGLCGDTERIYWADAGSGTIVARAISGGEPVVLAENLARPKWVALDQTDIYVGTEDSRGTDGAVVRVAKAGGPSQVLASAPGGVSGLVVAQEYVYWTQRGTLSPEGVVRDDGFLSRIFKEDREPAVLLTSLAEPGWLTIDGAQFVWAQRGTARAQRTDGAVAALPLQGGAVKTVVSSLHQVGGFAALDGQWAVGIRSRPGVARGGAVLRLDPKGGEPTTLAITAGPIGAMIWVDGHVCWVEEGPLRGADTRLYCKPPKPNAVATSVLAPRPMFGEMYLAERHLYIASPPDGTILRVERKRLLQALK